MKPEAAPRQRGPAVGGVGVDSSGRPHRTASGDWLGGQASDPWSCRSPRSCPRIEIDRLADPIRPEVNDSRLDFRAYRHCVTICHQSAEQSRTAGCAATGGTPSSLTSCGLIGLNVGCRPNGSLASGAQHRTPSKPQIAKAMLLAACEQHAQPDPSVEQPIGQLHASEKHIQHGFPSALRTLTNITSVFHRYGRVIWEFHRKCFKHQICASFSFISYVHQLYFGKSCLNSSLRPYGYQCFE